MVMIAQMKDKKQLKAKVQEAVCQLYETVSLDPNKGYHFPVGKKALKDIGYPRSIVDNVPDDALEAFVGVGYHFQNNAIKKGDQVLDIGSGAGTDTLIAANLVGPSGSVIGVDITEAMIEKLRKTAKENGYDNVSIKKGDGEKLPFNNNKFDVVISNGVINLIPNKQLVFEEAFRVLKPGGFLSIADIVLGKPISDEARKNPALWAECVVGASLIDDYLEFIKKAGFSSVEVVEESDYFALSESENTRKVAKQYGGYSVVIKAVKGGK